MDGHTMTANTALA